MNYRGEKNPKAVREYALTGKMFLLDLEDLEIENPTLITEETRKIVYANEVKIRTENAVAGFQNAKNIKCNIDASLEDLAYAERAIILAKKRNYEVPIETFNKGLEKILKCTADSYIASKALLEYVIASKLDLEKYKKELESNTLNLGNRYNEEYKKQGLNHILRNAKRLKKVVKKGNNNLVERLENYISKFISEVPLNGIEVDMIKYARQVAYERGVEFPISKARGYEKSNSIKAEKLLELARKNARILKMENKALS